MTTPAVNGELLAALGARERFGALALLAAFALFGLFDHGLWSANDTREGAMIAEMARTGDWTLPRLNGAPYLEKPPLLHWTGALLCRLAGTVNEGLVRLPAALYGFGTLLLVWRLGRRLGLERAGLLAACLCATSLLFAEYTRVVLTDAALMFMVLLALDLFWSAYTAAAGRRIRYLLFLLAAAAAFYAKGLLGPGFIWLSVGLFLLLRREGRRLAGLALAFLPVFLLVLAPWVLALARTGGRAFLTGVFWDNQFGRFLTFHDPALPLDPFFVHKEPMYYYLRTMPLRLLPWTLLAAAAAVQWFRPGTPYRGPLPQFLRCALAAMLLLLHVSAAKAASYVLPLFPLLFLMTGLWLEDALRGGAGRLARGLLAVTATALLLLVGLAPLALLAARLRHWTWGPHDCWPGATLAHFSLGLALVAGGGAAAGAVWLWRQWRAGRRACVGWQAPQVLAVLLVCNATALLPVMDRQRSYQPIAAAARQLAGPGGRVAYAGRNTRDTGALTFYLRSRLDILPAGAPVTNYLLRGTAPAVVILPAGKLPLVQPLLAGGPIRVLPIPQAGYKARDYVLLFSGRPAGGSKS